jgi:DNA-binding MarR family transcriptional regulator
MPSPARRQSVPAPTPESTAETIKDLLSYRIHRLANALSRGAALRYRREFGVSLMEWRILALLGGFAPLTLKDLARESGLDKSQASRAVAALVGRGLVLREIGPEDGREVALRLSAKGQRTYEGLMRAARERDAAFAACLTEPERAVLDTAILRLQAEARRQAALAAAAPPRGATARRRSRTES